MLTESVFRGLRDGGSVESKLRAEIEELSKRHRFFHWHLGFPQVFKASETTENRTGWTGGFDVVLGNPPWERVKLQEKEFFAGKAPEIARASNKAARDRLIRKLPAEDPTLWTDFQTALHDAATISHFLRRSGVYPLCGRGDVNTYAVFAELMRTIVGAAGRVGVIVPTGIATDATTQHFFADLVDRKSLVSLYDFENRKRIFPGIDSRIKFSLITVSGSERPIDEAEFCFFLLRTSDLADEELRFVLTADDFSLLNPNTKTCPIFRARRDAEVTKSIYRRVPILVDDNRIDGNPWGVQFQRMFDMANDSELFRTREQLEADGWTLNANIFSKNGELCSPLYEAKMVHQFSHRFGDYQLKQEDSSSTSLPPPSLEKLQDASYEPLPRYWVSCSEVGVRSQTRAQALLGWRKTARSTDERTVISSVLPITAVGDKFQPVNRSASDGQAMFASCLNSFVLDYVARQKVGGTDITYFIMKQLAVVSPKSTDALKWLDSSRFFEERVVELTCTSTSVARFAMDCGFEPSVYRFDPDRRFQMRAELDAALFHLYDVGRDDAEYIMETFPIVKRHDIKEHGSYRTKELILDVYDQMAKNIETGELYQTRLDPPPADPSLRVDIQPSK